MQFLVPQFIERNPKIFGPFTFKQFIIIGSAIAISVGLFFILPYSTFIILAVIIIGGSVIFVFFRIGKEPLPTYLKNLMLFSTTPKLYIWKKKSSLPIPISKKDPSADAKSPLNNLNNYIKTKKN
ncbi:MAG: PrgI family protein [Candidatus Nealsonbacteria bacterium]|nr:PrgI family protein [Candidatus Nealsonbacteria bacterium]